MSGDEPVDLQPDTVMREQAEYVLDLYTDICGPDIPDMTLTLNTGTTEDGDPVLGWHGPVEGLVPLGIAMGEAFGSYEAGEMMRTLTIAQTRDARYVTVTFPHIGVRG